MSELFTTISADPAWQYRDKLRMSKTKRSSEDQYRKTMTVDEICALYTPSRVEHEPKILGGYPHTRQTVIPGRLFDQFTVADEGFLILWSTAAALLEGHAVQVCRAWGFEPKQIGVWIKGRIEIVPPRDGAHGNAIDAALILQIGMGWALRGAVEFFIVATRGQYTKLLKNKGTPNVLLAPEDLVLLASKREHSRKPDEMYDLIERTFPGPYLELFAKHRREGWTQHGDELPAPTLQVPAQVGSKLDPPYSPSMNLTQLTPTGPDGAYERIYPDTAVEWP